MRRGKRLQGRGLALDMARRFVSAVAGNASAAFALVSQATRTRYYLTPDNFNLDGVRQQMSGLGKNPSVIFTASLDTNEEVAVVRGPTGAVYSRPLRREAGRWRVEFSDLRLTPQSPSPGESPGVLPRVSFGASPSAVLTAPTRGWFWLDGQPLVVMRNDLHSGGNIEFAAALHRHPRTGPHWMLAVAKSRDLPGVGLGIVPQSTA